MVGSVTDIATPRVLETLGWQELTLRVPVLWAPVKVSGGAETGTLVLGDGRITRVQVDWTRPRKAPDVSRPFNRMLTELAREGARHKGAIDPRDVEFPLSEGKSGRFATWRTGLGSAVAGVIICQECGRVTQLRVALRKGENAADVVGPLAASFEDHADDGQALWSLYGFRARIASSLTLVKSRIQPAHIALEFERGGLSVSVTRIGLAGVLIGDRPFGEWFRRFYASEWRARDVSVTDGCVRDHPGVRWTLRSPFARLLTLLRPAAAGEKGVAWWCRPANCVMVVRMCGRESDADALDAFSRGIACHEETVDRWEQYEAAVAGVWPDERFQLVWPRVSERVARVVPGADATATIVFAQTDRRGRQRHVSLDHVGSAVLAQCDGDTSLGKILEDFARTHRLHPREAELSVVPFLETLQKRGVVVMEKAEDR